MILTVRLVLVDNADGRLVADFSKTRVYLHVTFYKWSHGRVKRYREVLESVLRGLHRAGIDTVYATPFQYDTRAQRLVKYFGFTEVKRSHELVVMERRTHA